MADYGMFQELAQDVGFGREQAALLVEAGPLLEPSFPIVVDRFYDVIGSNPSARAVFEDDAQINRQKVFLVRWLGGLFSGTYDEAFFEQRARIGRVHVRIGLDQRYMFSMMNVLRTSLSDAMRKTGHDAGWQAGKVCDALRALDCLLDLELAIMLETYKEDLLEKMRGVERLATLGQLAATIGHELRNPLAVIDSSVHLLRRRTSEDERAIKHIDRIGRQVAVSNRIITDLLELVRDRPAERTPIELRSLVEDALVGLRKADDVSVVVDVDSLVPSVDDGQLRQVMVNLVQNAVDAGATEVHVGARDDEGTLELIIDDDGEGISKEARARLFEPLFTTKAKGSGLGLALCRRIAEKHGGTVAGENLPSGGARFVVRIPRAFGVS